MKKIIILLLSVIIIGVDAKGNTMFSESNTQGGVNTQITPYGSIPSTNSSAFPPKINSDLRDYYSSSGMFGSANLRTLTDTDPIVDPGDPIDRDLGDPLFPISGGTSILLALGLLYLLFMVIRRRKTMANAALQAENNTEID